MKPTNIYVILNSEGKITFKLDISFENLNFNRRMIKIKEKRSLEIMDIEDIAFLIFSLELKEDTRPLKIKINEFS
jgi:hypothetical protein